MSINIEDIKARNNIVDVIDALVPLKKAGKNYQACCPFHGEKTPSFTVSESKQFYHCFGCGAHGDAIGFVQEYYRVDFMEACKILGGEIDSSNHQAPTIKYKLRLPLDGEPLDSEVIHSFLTDKCESINNCFFYGRSQVLISTDIYKNNISLFTDDGLTVTHYKKNFLHGSCYVFGDISDGDNVILCQDYHLSRKIFNQANAPVICFFEPTNLIYINKEASKTKKVLVFCKDEEAAQDADDLNLEFERV